MDIEPLHYLTDDARLVEAACAGGVRWIQFRAKGLALEEWIARGREAAAVCRRHGARFIVNDSIQVALALAADGVHLGKEDAAPAEARRRLGLRAVIGGTANTADDVTRLSAAGVDYIGLGPYRFTETKERSKLAPLLGLGGVSAIARARAGGPPIIAIGGIVAGDIPALAEAGVHGIAVSGAISRAENAGRAAEELCGDVRRFFSREELAYETADHR